MRYDETLWHVPPCLAMCDGTPYFLPWGVPDGTPSDVLWDATRPSYILWVRHGKRGTLRSICR